MAELDLLLPVFQRLRRQGVALGIDDYLVAVEIIKAELDNLDDFPGLCRLLWAKSREDQQLFDQAMKELVPIPNYSPPERTNTQSQNQSLTPKTETPRLLQPPITEKLTTETQLRLRSPSVQPFPREDKPLAQTQSYQLIPRLPINRRDLAGVWRQLHRPQRGGVPELDLDATIHSICRTGLLLKPVLQPRRCNRAQLLVLVDCQTSMTPFAPLISAVIEGIERGGLLPRTSFYYFQDRPEKFIYVHPHLNQVPLETVLDTAQGNSVLIISDAGSARGYYEKERVAQTKAFIRSITSYTYLYAWLNPMPKNRWLATTAADIAQIIPMFPLDREGLNDAVNILRGYPFPVGVSINE